MQSSPFFISAKRRRLGRGKAPAPYVEPQTPRGSVAD